MAGVWEPRISSVFAENVSWEAWADVAACTLCKAMLTAKPEDRTFRLFFLSFFKDLSYPISLLLSIPDSWSSDWKELESTQSVLPR